VAEVAGKGQSAAVGLQQSLVGCFKFSQAYIALLEIFLGRFSAILEHYLSDPFGNVGKSVPLFINLLGLVSLDLHSHTLCLLPTFPQKLTALLLAALLIIALIINGFINLSRLLIRRRFSIKCLLIGDEAGSTIIG